MVVTKELIFNSFYFGEGVVVLKEHKELFCNSFNFGVEGVVVLKELDF